MALDRLTKIDGGGISTTSDYRVGIITASKFVGPFDGTGGNFSGVITATDGVFSGNVSIAGTLTYEDVTNIDSVGLITARDGIFLPDDKKLELGNASGSGDLQIRHISSTNQNRIESTTGSLMINQLGNGSSISLLATHIYLKNHVNNRTYLHAANHGAVTLYYDNVIKFATSEKGIKVGTGVTIETNGQANFAGIVTSNTLRLPDSPSGSLGRLQIGNGLDLSLFHDGTNSFLVNNTGYLSIQSQDGVNGIFIQRNAEVNLYYGPSVRLQTSSVGVTINNDLDVDGHTNLDNVSIAGVTTMSGNLKIESSYPRLYLTDTNHNSDYSIINNDGNFLIYDDTNTLDRLSILANGTVRSHGNFDALGGIDVTGNANVSGDLDVDGHTDLDNVSISGVTTITSAAPELHLTDTNANSDYSIVVNGGQFRVRDETNSANRLAVNSDGHVDIYGRLDAVGGFVASSNSAIEGNLELTSTYPSLTWTDTNHNSDFRITNNDGSLIVYDITRGAHVMDFLANGDVHIRNDKNLIIGEGSDLKIFHDSSANNNVIEGHLNSLNLRNYNVNCTDIVLSARRNIILQTNLNETGIQCLVNGATEIFYDGGATPKLRTTATGIQVLGEVAASQDYPNFRPTLDLNFAAEKKLDPRITYTRTGPASFVNEFGKVVIVGDNVPRFDHDPITRECKGLLIEESRTNYAQYSIKINNDQGSYYNIINNAVLVSDAGVAPDGTNTATKMYPASSGSARGIEDIYALPSTGEYTTSVYVKAAGHTGWIALYSVNGGTRAYFNPTTGAIGSPSQSSTPNAGKYGIQDVGNGWYRCHLTVNLTNTGGNEYFYIYFGDSDGSVNVTHSGQNGILMWGLQVEKGSFPTSYIPTQSDQVTRGADIVDIDGEDFTDFYNQTESTIISSHTLLPNVPNAENVYVYQIQDATTNHGIRVIDKNNSYGNVATGLVFHGGLSQFHFNNTTDSFTKEKVLVALSVKNNDFAGSHNGSTVETDTSGTLSTSMNSLGIGRYPPIGGYELNGHIQRFIYYPKQLSDSQLKTITS